MRSDDARARAADWVRALAERTAFAVGADYFRLLVRALVEVVGVPCAAVVSRPQQQGIARLLASHCDGTDREDDTFDISGTVSGAVAGSEVLVVTTGLQARFRSGLGPINRLIIAESCLVVPTLDAASSPTGHLVIADRKPREWDESHAMALNALSARTAEEIDRGRARRWVGSIERISHDLRSPLNGIIGYAGLLMHDASLGPGHRASASKILECGHRLLSAVNHLEDVEGIDGIDNKSATGANPGGSEPSQPDTSARGGVRSEAANGEKSLSPALRRRVLDHARRGDIVEVRRCLDELEHGARESAFVVELRALAGAFDLKAIRERLEEASGAP